MSGFVDAIQTLSATYRVQPQHRRIPVDRLAEAVRLGAIDSVDFSQNARNLFGIAQTDRFFDTAFGLPADLNDAQQAQLREIQQQMQLFFGTDSQNLSSFVDTLRNGVEDYLQTNGTRTDSALQDALNGYIVSKSFSRLLGNDTDSQQGTDIFTRLGESHLGTLFAANIRPEELENLGKLSTQLNRLFFQSSDRTFNDLLDRYNDLYGLQKPSDTVLAEAKSRLQHRNSLFADLLGERSTPLYAS